MTTSKLVYVDANYIKLYDEINVINSASSHLFHEKLSCLFNRWLFYEKFFASLRGRFVLHRHVGPICLLDFRKCLVFSLHHAEEHQ